MKYFYNEVAKRVIEINELGMIVVFDEIAAGGVTPS